MPEITRYANDRTYACRPAANGVWYVYWSEGGRSKRASTRQKTVAAAQAFLDEFVRLETAPARELTCADLFEIRYPDPSERHMAAWKNLAPHFGSKTPAEITSRDEAAYARARGVAPSTLRFELALLRACWNGAVKKRLLDLSDLPALDPLPKQSPPRDRWLSDAEVQRLFDAAPVDTRVGLFLRVALHTAARRTAIQDLQWGQVDWSADGGRGVIHFLPEGTEQTRKRRASVPISSALRPVLERAHAEKVDDYVIGAGGHVNGSVHRVAARAGVSRVTPHVLRHTAATRMARAGVSLWIVAQVLGNTIEQVEKVYAKYQPEMARRGVEAIGV